MAIKETPTNYKVYYRLMKERTSKQIDEARDKKDELEEICRCLHDKIENDAQAYKNTFGIDILSYKEFNENKYIDGRFYKDAKGLFLNRKDNYRMVSELYDLYMLADRQHTIKTIDNDVKHYNKLLALSINQYKELLKLYYTEVHKKLILEGCGYLFGEHIGWICINRVILGKSKKKTIDYAATKKREAELKAQGKRIWNKEDAEWCKANGIEYVAEDKRVYRNDEYYYEIPLLDSKLPNAHDLELTISDYRHASYKGKTNDDLVADCNNDKNKICELNLDLKTKLTLCNKVDKLLYNNFIRNENQKSFIVRKTNS